MSNNKNSHRRDRLITPASTPRSNRASSLMSHHQVLDPFPTSSPLSSRLMKPTASSTPKSNLATSISSQPVAPFMTPSSSLSSPSSPFRTTAGLTLCPSSGMSSSESLKLTTTATPEKRGETSYPEPSSTVFSPPTSRSRSRSSSIQESPSSSQMMTFPLPATTSTLSPFSFCRPLSTHSSDHTTMNASSTTGSFRKRSLRPLTSDCEHCEESIKTIGEMVLSKRHDQRRIADLESQVQSGADNNNTSDSMARLEAELIDSESKRDTLQARVRELDAFLEECKTNVSVVEGEKEAYYNRMLGLAREKRDMKKFFESELQKSRGALTEKERENKSLEAEVEQQKAMSVLRAAELKKKDKNISRLEKERNALRIGLSNRDGRNLRNGRLSAASEISFADDDARKEYSHSDIDRDEAGEGMSEEEHRTSSENPHLSRVSFMNSSTLSSPTVKYGSKSSGVSAPLKGNLQILKRLSWSFCHGASQADGSDHDSSTNDGVNTGMKRKRGFDEKQSKRIRMSSFSSAMQLSLRRLKDTVASVHWRDNNKLPLAIKPVVFQVTMDAIICDEYGEDFFAFLATIFPFEKEQVVEYVKLLVFEDHLALLTNRQNSLLKELGNQVQKAFPKIEAERERAVYKAKSQHRKLPHHDRRYFPTSRSMRALMWELILLSNECWRLERENKTLQEGKYTGFTSMRFRGRMQDSIHRKFPEGWMSKKTIVAQISRIKQGLMESNVVGWCC